MHVHRSERTDTLLTGLAELLGRTPADPFVPEIVAVPTPGIERFITQGLGLHLGTSPDRRDGICANVDFPSPTRVFNRVIAQATGITPDADPWLPHRSVWPLLKVIDESLDQPGFEALRAYLDGHSDRRFALASRLSAMFASYAGQRPGMLLDWVDNRDDVPADLIWQPRLWRRLRDEIAIPGPAERLASACTAISQDPSLSDLPGRVSAFGPSRLPAGHLQVFEALAEHREIHLWLADASPALWSALSPEPAGPRRDDMSSLAAVNPLLRSLGRDARELRVRLPAGQDHHHAADLEGGTLLGALQRQIRDNVSPGPAEPDASIQVHACHGQPRQAEVVREVVLRLLQDDPTLEPRDILIMCPDLEAFAPLLSAAFSDAPGELRLRIADRTPEQANAVLASLAALLDMVSGRIELSALLDFAARPPVRRRFGFDDEDLERLETLTTAAGIRWGLDGTHRADYHLRTDMGTWTWGLDRLLLGVAMSEDGLEQLGGVLPLDDVQSGDVELIGELAGLVTVVQRVREQMHDRHTVGQWVDILTDAVTDLMDARGPDAWQLPNALGAVATLTDTADGYTGLELSLADITWLLAEVLAGRPTRSNFRSGDLTACGMMPMRSVPHRVICLVGMDDGAFPRDASPDGDDVMARDPLIGERDPRSEDRQTMLDAIMAATDHLVITYTGANDRTNEAQPPCVPLGDLLDTLDAMTGDRARDRLCVRHPLQPFDDRNFTPALLGTPEPFSHDTSALAAAQRAAGPRTPAPTLLIAELPASPLDQLSPQDLGEFLRSPVAAYLRRRIGISLRRGDEPPPEQIPIEVGPLDRWAIGDRTLTWLNRGEPAERVARAERARGQLPPGAMGASELAAIGNDATDVAQRFAALRTADPRQVTVDIHLPNGVRVSGAVPGIYGDRIVRATYSKSKPRDELRLWPELLALAVAEPGTPSAHMVTKDGGVTLDAPADPLGILSELVDLYAAGMRSALPLPAGTSRAYATLRAAGQSSQAAMGTARYRQWQGKYSERNDPEFVALWGVDAPFEVLISEPARDDENWFDEATRFGMLARHLWEPILAARR